MPFRQQARSDGACDDPLGLCQTRLSNAKMRRAERFPKLFAASVCAGIISAGLMANEILQPRLFPRFRGFAPLHKVTVEKHRENGKQIFLRR